VFGGEFQVKRLYCILAGTLAVLGLGAPAALAESPCEVTEIAPGVKMRGANCPTLIGRPAAMQPNRVDNALQQPPAGLYRYSDVEMRVVGPRAPSGAPAAPLMGVTTGAVRP
jgi:hypothetical protein